MDVKSGTHVARKTFHPLNSVPQDQHGKLPVRKAPTKARMGRPPGYKTVGPVDYHLGLRLDRLRKAQLAVLVALENGRAKKSGKKSNVTASSLVSTWIRKRLDVEIRRKKLSVAVRGELARNMRRRASISRDSWEAQLASLRESGH